MADSVPNAAEREPLAPNPNGATLRTFPLLRRKAPNPSLPQFSSSTETPASAHPSVYDASAHPSADSLIIATNLAKAADDLAWLQGIDPVHKPHRLDAITEKNSRSTLVTHRSFSVGASGPKSIGAASWADESENGKKKAVEDMAWLVGTKQSGFVGTTPSSVHNALATTITRRPKGHVKYYTTPLPRTRTSRFSEILSSEASPPHIEETLPKLPHRDPPHRSATPPGLPTFNTPAAEQYKLSRPQMRLRDYVKRDSPLREYKRQTHRLPPGVLMRGEGRFFVKGKWRAGPSGHLGGEMGRENLHYRTPAVQPRIMERSVPDVREASQSDWKRVLKSLRGTCLCATTEEVNNEVREPPMRVRSLRSGMGNRWVDRRAERAHAGLSRNF